jgi:hydrogenase small subunit
MAHEDHGVNLYEQLAAHGVSRRDFLKWCGSIAGLLGLSEAMAPTVASAVEGATAGGLKPAIWLEGGLCTGCTESVAQSTYPDVATIVLDILSLNAQDTLSWAQGKQFEEAAVQTAEKNPNKFLLIYEGSVMQGWDGNALRIADKTGLQVLEEFAPKAEAIIAIGSCAVDGGWVKADPNPADATGVLDYLTKKGIKTPVINLPTCPVNPEWVVAMVVDVLLLGELPSMDAQNRPTGIYGQTIHDNCPRRGHFENGEFVYTFGSEEEAKGYCLYAVGCKGPQSYTNCPIVRWNNQVSWCVESGGPCIGCGSFNWVDQNAPFLKRFRNITYPVQAGGVQPTTYALAAGGVVLAGLVAHGIGTKVAGRRPNGAPTEEMKEYDRRHAAKGGGK